MWCGRDGNKLQPWPDVSLAAVAFSLQEMHVSLTQRTHLTVYSARWFVIICFGSLCFVYSYWEFVFIFYRESGFHVYRMNLFSFYNPLRRHVGSHITDGWICCVLTFFFFLRITNVEIASLSLALSLSLNSAFWPFFYFLFPQQINKNEMCYFFVKLEYLVAVFS